MRMLSILLVMLTSQVVTTHAVEFRWREKTPAQIQEWFQSREELKLGGPESALGKADEVKERALKQPRHFHQTRIYKLADGNQLELNHLRIGSPMGDGFLFLRQYGVWKVDATGLLRSPVWKSPMVVPDMKPVRIQFRESKSKGDVPEKMYEIKDGAVG
ncbi:MAG: hypothetical protein EOP87_22265 [Verrucomicrobiaceae bacterium]|nr:MAG: hypothetical protein EOP87_22265 [Verrucomicrobiaceae bacterium]